MLKVVASLIAAIATGILLYRLEMRVHRLERRFQVPKLKVPRRPHTDPEDMIPHVPPMYGRPVHGIRGVASCSACGKRHDVEGRCL